MDLEAADCPVMERSCTYNMSTLRTNYGLSYDMQDFVNIRARAKNQFHYQPSFSADTHEWTTNKTEAGLVRVTDVPYYVSRPNVTDYDDYNYIF